jgi:hypothetical protein
MYARRFFWNAQNGAPLSKEGGRQAITPESDILSRTFVEYQRIEGARHFAISWSYEKSSPSNWA